MDSDENGKASGYDGLVVVHEGGNTGCWDGQQPDGYLRGNCPWETPKKGLVGADHMENVPRRRDRIFLK